METKINVVYLSIQTINRNNNRTLDKIKLKVLLEKNKNKLSLPSFSFDYKKSLIDIVKEKSKNIIDDEVYFEQLYTFGEKKYYTKDNGLTISYLGILNEEMSKKSKDKYYWYDISIEDLSISELEKSQKFSLSNQDEQYEYILKTIKTKVGITYSYIHEVDDECIISGNGAIILMTALKRIRSNIDTSDIAFKLLNSSFTLTELQQVYELIENKELDKGNFRRKIKDLVEKSDGIKKDSAHRPSKYFKLKENAIKDYV